jgi:hypothetical protein
VKPCLFVKLLHSRSKFRRLLRQNVSKELKEIIKAVLREIVRRGMLVYTCSSPRSRTTDTTASVLLCNRMITPVRG